MPLTAVACFAGLCEGLVTSFQSNRGGLCSYTLSMCPCLITDGDICRQNCFLVIRYFEKCYRIPNFISFKITLYYPHEYK